MASELKRCPFCNSDRITVHNIRDGQQAVCKDCGSHGKPVFHGPKGPEATWGEAVAAWNTRPAPVATDTVHADDIAVDRFAIAMKEKLAKKREEGRGGWENKEECSAEYLSYLLIQHIWKGDPIDVANLAMMLQQRGDRIVIDSETSPIVPRHPAATDTGLETFSVELTPSGHPYMKSDPDGDYVTRSQAEELLAAEQAKAAEKERLRFEGDLDKWMKIIGAGITGYQPEAYTLMDLACQELVRLRADNAAQAARINELEEVHLDAADAEPGEHQEILDALEAHNSGEEQ